MPDTMTGLSVLTASGGNISCPLNLELNLHELNVIYPNTFFIISDSILFFFAIAAYILAESLICLSFVL